MAKKKKKGSKSKVINTETVKVRGKTITFKGKRLKLPALTYECEEKIVPAKLNNVKKTRRLYCHIKKDKKKED